MKINKQEIKRQLQHYVERFESQNRAANSLKGVSAATISHMINGKWELIKDEMWRNVASQIDYSENTWVVVETANYKLINMILKDAQKYSHAMAITEEAGAGKSQTMKHYAANNKKAYLLKCSEYWNKKWFLQELLTAMGKDAGGFTIAEMMQEAVRSLKMEDRPLIIMDEADKLTDQVLYFFITLYNQLEDHCGIVLCATNHLSKRIKRGVGNNKKGYKEIYSRLGRKFITLPGVNATDITQVCNANGVTETADVKKILEDCDADLRRVKRMVHAILMKKGQKEVV